MVYPDIRILVAFVFGSDWADINARIETIYTFDV